MSAKLLFTFLISLPLLNACTKLQAESVKNFTECVEAGNKILKTYPAKCITKDGQVFLEITARPMCKDLCGDGECQEIVCMGQGCPCAEDSGNCPKDCK